MSEDSAKLQVGKKLQARILWDIVGTEPRQFALSTLEHILRLEHRKLQELQKGGISNGDDEDEPGNDVKQAYPIGTILDNVKVSRVDADRGLFLDVCPGLQGVVHVRTTIFLKTWNDVFGRTDIGRLRRARTHTLCNIGALQSRLKTPRACYGLSPTRRYPAMLDER